MACKFCNESHLLPNLYARVQRFSAIRGVSVKKKESPNSRSGKWTPLTLNDENLVLIYRNFTAIGQLNEPFIAIVINDDTVAMTFPRKQKFTKCSNQIGAVIFVCVHGS